MDISALLTSAGINIAVCVVLFSLYSILRKQPSNVNIYFRQRLSQLQLKRRGHFNRFVPSASWIVKAWEASEDELYACGGIDAVVFLKIVVFSIRIFSIAAFICIFLVLPFNYYGQGVQHSHISSEIDVFTMGNIKDGSTWLWAHCVALYTITCCACILLYHEYKNVARMRLERVIKSPTRLSHFTVLLRAVPRSSKESYSDSVRKFFTNYYASSYLSHQIVYRSGTFQKLMGNAEKMYRMIKSTSVKAYSTSQITRCGLCGGTTNSFKMLPGEPEIDERATNFYGNPDLREKECAAALVYFRTRYAALVASDTLQSPDPMSWVTDLAPEPHDVHWKNLCVPYKLLWIRRKLTLLTSIVFLLLFLGPTTFVQGLTYLDKLESTFPFLKGILTGKLVSIVTGYLPSLVLMLFLAFVPPIMMLFSTVEGPISRSGRKKSACNKVLLFMIWNVFFANILSGSVIQRLGKLTGSSPKDLANLIANAVPRQAYFFMTYIMTSGWTSLSLELLQPFGLICNWFRLHILRKKDADLGLLTFPYHTEVPRVLLLGLLGLTFSVLAPLMLPFLLVYYFLAYLVYRNQILNVYMTRYQTGGLYWPIMHNTTIFSLILTQVIAGVLFGIKKASAASTFTIPLIILTLLFNMYCRQKFLPIFKQNPAQVLIEMDRADEQSGKTEGILDELQSAYCQFTVNSTNQSTDEVSSDRFKDSDDSEEIKPTNGLSLDHQIDADDSNDTKPVKLNGQAHQSSPQHTTSPQHTNSEIHEVHTPNPV